MTAGQGGQYGRPGSTGSQSGPQDGPEGPPQGRQPPPPPPPGWQPPPPPGWNAPPQPYPYGPAPTPPQAYGPPPPGSAERPLTVRAGIGAFVVNFVLGLIVSVVSFADIDDLVREAVRRTNDPQITEDVLRTAILVGAVVGLVLVVLHALFIWWAWRGRNWARIVLWVLGGLNVLAGVGTLGGSTGETDFLAGLSVFQVLALVTGIVLLALQPSNEWYRYMGWARAGRR
jgi:hypothetical protein